MAHARGQGLGPASLGSDGVTLGPPPDRSLFDCSPIPTAEHDYSAVVHRARELRAAGVTDLDVWLAAHPGEIADLASRVRVLDVNRAGLALTAAASKAEATASLTQYLLPESLPAFGRALLTLLSGSPLVDCELAFRDRRGREMTVVAYAAPLPGSEATLEHVLVCFLDVTEREEAERRLLENEAILKASQWIAR
ncbi:MAG TPA: hypothetical protein VLT61_07675, partial [Anaeromyxobacteraceae bacterium]|nr:hypothetical protein [Anaeromyxobacteraceae bacterium]